MLCQHCGNPLDGDYISCDQKIGLSVDNPEGEVVEVARFVSSATCSLCGTYNLEEFTCGDNKLDLTYLDYDNGQNTTNEPYEEPY